MKRSILLLIPLLACTLVTGQVPKKIVVEHFTNTLCSVCASRNPGFYTNLQGHPQVMHLAIHPSAPYKNCALNKHNTFENDARTNLYGVYGSTPRLMINGEPVSASANYSAGSIFDPYLNQTSPASISIKQEKFGADSIRVNITIKAEQANSLDTVLLFAAIAEDTLFYNAPNGENTHYDVFRKSLTGATGMPIVMPSNIGDSVVFNASSVMNAEWDPMRVYTFALLQSRSDKKSVQAERTLASDGVITSIEGHKCSNEPAIFPNPTNDILNIRHSAVNGAYSIGILDLQGKEVHTAHGVGTGNLNTRVDVSDLRPGIYFIEIVCADLLSRNKILIK